MKTELTQAGEKGILPGLVFRTTRDIAAGEELTVSYYHPDDYVSCDIIFCSPLKLAQDAEGNVPVLKCHCEAPRCLGVVFWD
jgi:SET domain-containing protein